jgi:hypothetical protein
MSLYVEEEDWRFLGAYLATGGVAGKRGTAQETRVVDIRALLQVEC